MSKITDKDVLSATANGDGTHNGIKLVQWLMEAATGKSMSDADARDLMNEAVAKAKEKRAARNANR
jgi:hypothetical protein